MLIGTSVAIAWTFVGRTGVATLSLTRPVRDVDKPCSWPRTVYGLSIATTMAGDWMRLWTDRGHSQSVVVACAWRVRGRGLTVTATADADTALARLQRGPQVLMRFRGKAYGRLNMINMNGWPPLPAPAQPPLLVHSSAWLPAHQRLPLLVQSMHHRSTLKIQLSGATFAGK